MAIGTSLPELAASVASALRGEAELALGNVLGANAFVFLVLVVADLCALRGVLFSMMDQAGAFTSIAMAAIAILMEVIVLIAIARRPSAARWRMSLPSIGLACLYLASLVVTYYLGVP